MSDSQRVIARLPIPTQTKLRSTQILTSLPQIVLELVQNSLDAGASKVDVGLDAKEWICWVCDDGRGMTKSDLELLGQGTGARYNTSKSYAPGGMNSLTTFGFRGEALTSAAEISCLEICSRASKSRKTWSVILKGSKQLYIGPAVRWKRETPGTAVSIRDAFFNLPVRRLSHPNPSRTWDLVRQEIETYSLMFPHVSFTIEDTSNTGEGTHHKDRIIRIPKSHSTLQSFRHIFGHALTEYVEEIDVAFDSMRLEGFISLTGAPSKAYQFLYVNRHPVDISDLRRLIDTQFASSSFGKNRSQALDEEGEKSLPRSTIRRSPRKNEKKPVYVLNLSITPEEVDNCFDPTKSIIQLQNKVDVTSFLSTTIQDFLEKQGFMTYRKENPLGEIPAPSPSPRKRKKVDVYGADDSGYAEQNPISEIKMLSLQDYRPEVASSNFYASMDGPEEVTWSDQATGECFVVHTRTGHSFPQKVNRSSQMESEPTAANHEEGRRTLRQQETKNMATADASVKQDPMPKWLEQALESNRTYAITENRIPSVPVPPTKDHIASTNDLFRNHECHGIPDTSTLVQRTRIGALHSGYEHPTHRFTKDDLRRAAVINQVDRKFIACRIAKRSNAGSPNEDAGDVRPQNDYLLVLIDQHAADERVRVERFLKELCLGILEPQSGTDGGEAPGIRVREVTPPRPVLLTQHEALTIKRSPDVRTMLRKWGVRFVEPSKVHPVSDSISDSGSSAGYSQLLVSGIPDIVSDKLLQGDELRDFIKGFLGQIQSGELFSDCRFELPSEADQDEFLWLKAVRRCPKGLLDLINSKACRGISFGQRVIGAIMFNDSLSIAQCEKLVGQLSETAFPFQCAHGRPSLVPLVEAGGLQTRSRARPNLWNDWNRLETMSNV